MTESGDPVMTGSRSWLRANCYCVKEPDAWAGEETAEDALRHFDEHLGWCSNEDCCRAADALEARAEAAESDLENAIRREVVRDMEIEELYAEIKALKGRSRDD